MKLSMTVTLTRSEMNAVRNLENHLINLMTQSGVEVSAEQREHVVTTVTAESKLMALGYRLNLTDTLKLKVTLNVKPKVMVDICDTVGEFYSDCVAPTMQIMDGIKKYNINLEKISKDISEGMDIHTETNTAEGE